MPIPSDFVVKKGSKMSCAMAGSGCDGKDRRQAVADAPEKRERAVP
jgi:hypothetical protein